MTWLRFRMDLSKKPESDLVWGELSIMEGGATTQTFKVTSGIAPHQHLASEHLKGRGPIPACKAVGLNSYFVRTTPFFRPDTIGIEGNFYYIEPDPVKIRDFQRGEFGIHFDASVPGSAGCIVFSARSDWRNFEDFMSDYRQKGFSQISLVVEYNHIDPVVPTGATFFTVNDPTTGQTKFVDQPTNFSGTATSQVEKVIVTAGVVDSTRIFPVAEVKPDETGAWSFSDVLVSTGKDRPFKFTAIDSSGRELQTTEMKLTFMKAGQARLSPGEAVFTVEQPTDGEQRRVNRPVRFAGTVTRQVAKIVVNAGPGGPFTVGQVEPSGGTWAFEQVLLSPGSDRTFTFTAFDSSGIALQSISINLTFIGGQADLSKIPSIWKSAATLLVPKLVEAFRDQGIVSPIVLAYAAAAIGRESSWNPRAENTTDAAARTGYPGRGLAQITWDFNYKAVGKATGIDFFGDPDLMFIPYNSLRAKAAFYQINEMIPFIEAGDFESAAGIYIAGSRRFRSSYTRNVAADTQDWLSVFKA
ncbi:hypothetical protein AB3R30_24640 [Leptolyngbyaceae cyanobacterium UHCC 1019]